MIYTCVDDYRRAAKSYLPKTIFDFVDGGSEREITLRANRGDFENIFFNPRTLVDVGKVDLSTELLGEQISMPLIIAPTGLAAIVHTEGDVAAARAAEQAGIPHVLSTTASDSIEKVAAGAGGNKWFQLYFFRDRELTRGFVERAQANDYQALVMTVDLVRGGKREKDIRNGFTVPPRITPQNFLDMVGHPRWLLRMAPHLKKITMGNVEGIDGAGEGVVALSAFMNEQLDPTISWDDLAWLRGIWDKPLLVKGVLNAEDARRMVDMGADGIIISNHGGRQLDGAPSTISVLREIADAVAGDADIILDSGIRRGADIVKALALGATACGIGKSMLYGLAVDGQSGVSGVIEMLRREIDLAMAMTGTRQIADLTADTLR
ncbi:MAG: L-lactate dehydrogenase [Gammaproteobacteria bacterium]|nr:MAG: L-lactate dehydrogenase [Gammaproteobacteria bacterium]RLA11902.1 MAG: L-lactate dehydrogenase [Gammaproteobacteria bacterium]RLA14687.1 MAG: L-lactate dehydrogenase [Gammaproteobacteria bacterium]